MIKREDSSPAASPVTAGPPPAPRRRPLCRTLSRTPSAPHLPKCRIPPPPPLFAPGGPAATGDDSLARTPSAPHFPPPRRAPFPSHSPSSLLGGPSWRLSPHPPYQPNPPRATSLSQYLPPPPPPRRRRRLLPALQATLIEAVRRQVTEAGPADAAQARDPPPPQPPRHAHTLPRPPHGCSRRWPRSETAGERPPARPAITPFGAPGRPPGRPPGLRPPSLVSP